jgi:hypothetical protein
MNGDLLARLERAFREPAPTDEALFGGDILALNDAKRPEVWPGDWRRLDCSRLSTSDWHALSGLGLRHYLPALLSAALAGDVRSRITAEMLLTEGLADFHRDLPIRWRGETGSWRDMRARHLSAFTPTQAGLVVEFLLRGRDDARTMDDAKRRIEQALENFWLEQAESDRAAFWAAHGRLPAPEAFDPSVLESLPPPPEPPQLERQVEEAFLAPYPGDDAIRGGDMGCEPEEVAALYRGKTDWRGLDPEFLDRAGLGFLSAEAFRFYLPAFLLADLANRLQTETPAFRLSHGLDNLGRVNRVNPNLYGELTWFEHMSARFSLFTAEEASAICGYLRWTAGRDDGDLPALQAVANYWWPKATAG